MKLFDRQEVFDKVTTHLLTQMQTSRSRAASVGVNPGCAYRGDGGLKCAIGGLILDEHYSLNLERKTILDLPVIDAVEKSLGCSIRRRETAVLDLLSDKGDVVFLLNLQQVHDKNPPGAWFEVLEKQARDFGLKFNPPKE